MLAYLFSLGSEGQCNHDSSCFNVSRQKSPAMLALKYLFPLTPSLSPTFSFPHHINPVAYQQLLSQQRSLNAFGHTPPLIQQSPSSFSARQHPLTASPMSSHNSTNSEANQVTFTSLYFKVIPQIPLYGYVSLG